MAADDQLQLYITTKYNLNSAIWTNITFDQREKGEEEEVKENTNNRMAVDVCACAIRRRFFGVELEHSKTSGLSFLSSVLSDCKTDCQHYS